MITESLKDHTRNTVQKSFASLDDFLTRWNSAERKAAILKQLKQEGVLFDALAKEVGKELDPFDMICHVVFDQPPLTRSQRAQAVHSGDYLSKYAGQAQAVLEALLEKYVDEGIEPIEDINILRVQPLNEFGTTTEIINLFGSREQFVQAIRELEAVLYESAA